MTNLGAWHGNQEEKDWMIKEAQEHAKADRFIAGAFGNMDDGSEFKGCSVGCSIRSINIKNCSNIDTGSHDELAEYIGLECHGWLVRMQDSIFEALNGAEQISWTERLFTSIQVGADISLVLPRFLSFILTDTLTLVQSEYCRQQKDAIQNVIHLMDEWHKTGVEPGRERFNAADTAATAAVTADFVDAVASCARTAASCARTAAHAAAYAARDTRTSFCADTAALAASTAAAARKEKWELYADKLIELLTESGEAK
jgi:hypothetical protein